MLRIGICDDEKVFCDELNNLLLRFSMDYKVEMRVSYFSSGEHLLTHLQQEQYQILFLDILMGDMNGVNVGKIIREERHDYSTAIVYISATQEYTMELFQNQPLDFIMKPATYEEITKILLRYLDIQKRQNRLFSYQYGTDLRVLPISEIVYFESQGRRIRIVMLQGETQCYYTMKKLVKEYNLVDFVRCHNSYFVNINYVKEVSANHMKLVNEEKIPISQARKSQVFEKLKNWNHSEI